MARHQCDRIISAHAPDGMPSFLDRASHEVRLIGGEVVGQCRAVFFTEGGMSGFCLRTAFIDSGLNPNPEFKPCRICAERR